MKELDGRELDEKLEEEPLYDGAVRFTVVRELLSLISLESIIFTLSKLLFLTLLNIVRLRSILVLGLSVGLLLCPLPPGWLSERPPPRYPPWFPWPLLLPQLSLRPGRLA